MPGLAVKSLIIPVPYSLSHRDLPAVAELAIHPA
jgi:hypothetical protein